MNENIEIIKEEKDGGLQLIKRLDTSWYMVMLDDERQMKGNPNYDNTNAGLYKRKSDAERLYNEIKKKVFNEM